MKLLNMKILGAAYVVCNRYNYYLIIKLLQSYGLRRISCQNSTVFLLNYTGFFEKNTTPNNINQNKSRRCFIVLEQTGERLASKL